MQNSTFAPAINRVLDHGTAQLDADGFSARSGFLSSSTFGGLSWLAHITTQSGIRIGTQRGYNQLAKSNRLTLATAFKRAGWRTVSEDPANKRRWKEGTSYYHYDHIYDRRNIGYKGPTFGLPPCPTNTSCTPSKHRELAKPHRRPVFAEIDLISSHAPWTKIPRLIPWNKIGDGSIYHHIPLQQTTTAKLFGDDTRARTAYGTLHPIHDEHHHLASSAATPPTTPSSSSSATTNPPPPSAANTPPTTSPSRIIAHDPNITHQITNWHWQPGLHPTPTAPVWPMETFRDRFLKAFGSTPTSG